MSRLNPLMLMTAVLVATASTDDVVIVDHPPEPRPEPRREPGVLVVRGRDDWGRQPEPVFTPWGPRPPRPYQLRRQDDAEAKAAAQAKRDRKAKKRLGGL